MTNVKIAAGIRQHRQGVVLGSVPVHVSVIETGLVPGLLPSGLDVFVVVALDHDGKWYRGPTTHQTLSSTTRYPVAHRYPAAMPTAYVIQHEDDANSGMIGEAAIAHGFDLDVYQSDASNTADPRDPADVDIVIVLGSHGSWTDIDRLPHLQQEMKFIEDTVSVDTPILGICFGGQGLALALGGSVERSPTLELGWFEVQTVDDAMIQKGPWFEWHEDRFTAPPDAELLAWSDMCHQAYRFGPHLGLQFHPEVTHQLTVEWRDTMSLLPDIDPDAVIAATKANEPAARRRAFELFDRFLELGNE